jgi:hypothetical protein
MVEVEGRKREEEEGQKEGEKGSRRMWGRRMRERASAASTLVQADTVLKFVRTMPTRERRVKARSKSFSLFLPLAGDGGKRSKLHIKLHPSASNLCTLTSNVFVLTKATSPVSLNLGRRTILTTIGSPEREVERTRRVEKEG